MASDAQLLAAVAAGDRRALAVLYERHAPWLTVRLSRRCGDAGVVDEVLQDTFLAVWKGARRYAGEGEVGAWVWGIAIRASWITFASVVPDPNDGSVCVAAGQARAVLALWAGAHATDDAPAGLKWLIDQSDPDRAWPQGRSEQDAVLPIAEGDVYGGFVVSYADIRLALRMLEVDGAAARVAERWELLTDPATTSLQLTDALGLEPLATGPPQDPFIGHMELDIATLGPPCR